MTRLLQDWVTEQAEKRPDAPAVVSDAARLTYAKLDTSSTQLARLLKDAGCRKGDRVALLMPKSAMAIVALVAIYKADCIYVPLDPSSPAGRLKKILDSCENRWILAGGSAAGVLGELFREERWRQHMSIGWLDDYPPAGDGFQVEFTLDDVAHYPAAPLEYRNGSQDPAHILFTSGSTGTPKGVVVTHSNVVHFVEWATKYFAMDSSDRMSGHSPLHFDMSLFDIFCAAAVGGELHLVSPELNVLPNKLVEFIRAAELTQWFSVPSVLNYLARFDVVRFDDFPFLKRVLWAGEVFPTPMLMYWMKRLPHVTFTNLYGPTETTIASSYFTVPKCPDDPRAAIPIGTACDGEELLVLNESMQPIPRAQTGDLYIAGVGLTRGYWQDPERTDAAFRHDPRRPFVRLYKTGDLARIGDDGLVYFLGRNDSQIKSRGYRIELGEIEAALNTIPGVRECAVVAVNTGGFEGAVICCAYVSASDGAVTPATLRREAGRLIPSYMLPTRWLEVDQVPQNVNGKIDRRRLKEMFDGEVRAACVEQTTA